jgi:Na+-transporting methylmalonyl-CoA/oxaloacetate decarboxylase beta subunit
MGLELFSEMLAAVTWQNIIMMGVGALLIYLAVKKDFEPNLLLPMGFGTILVNLPLSSAIDQIAGGKVVTGALSMLFNMGVANELLPLLILVAVGAMCDFGPLLENPKVFLFGITAQAGIFLTMGLALLLGFNLYEAASIGIIGAADGPTSIYVSTLCSEPLGTDIRGGLYLYGAGAAHPAACHQGPYDKT